jgi:glutamate--cysteine ligase
VYLPENRESRPLESTDELVAHFEASGKPADAWRVGTEYEMIGVYRRPPALGAAPPHGGERGMGVLLERMSRAGWSPVHEDDHIIALVRGRSQVTLEPGGQLELAAQPVESAAALERELADYVAWIAAPSDELDIAWLGLGFRPFGTLDDVPWMPKARYAVMREFLPPRGRLAHEMMKRTATVQVNVDYADAADAAAKLRCAMSVTSILTALYAASPIVDGAVSGFQSYRAEVWRFVDPSRCGLLRFAFDPGNVFRAYTEWALDVPMFFVHRGGYRPVGGMTFRAFMRDGFDGTRATLDDWELHLSTLFPEARLKRFLEVRGCDGGSLEMVAALAPLCRGLLYDATARDAATALTAPLSFDERLALQIAVARQGLAAPVGGTGRTVGQLARELVAVATDGLRRVAPDDIRYLDPVRAIAESGRTQADAIIDLWQTGPANTAARIAKLAHPGLGRG